MAAKQPTSSYTSLLQSNEQLIEQEYDFVEEPNQDYYCPVSLELLEEPHQTTCCGQHLSVQASLRLVQGGKPCPMCKKESFNTNEDLYFKRKVRELMVHCPEKKSGCEWVGELGSLNLHTESCPKRPWKCKYCDFESNYETGPKEHTPTCAKYPLPCPNQCGIGMVPRCDAEKHQLVCPLQLVECELIGCDVKVPRRDLAKHMTENAQHHLMSATLLNLQLTRELHQKMKEKDQQIADLRKQMKGHEDQILKQVSEVVQKHTKSIINETEQSMNDLYTKLQQHTHKLKTKTENTADSNHSKIVEKTSRAVGVMMGFTFHKFTLTHFTKCRESKGGGSWYSDPFYNLYRGYRFQLNIDTNGAASARGTHLTAYLCLLPGDYDKELEWPIMVTVHLEMLNQRGDHNHHSTRGTISFDEFVLTRTWGIIGTTKKFYPLDKLEHNTTRDTEYLKDDCIRFLLSLKVE